MGGGIRQSARCTASIFLSIALVLGVCPAWGSAFASTGDSASGGTAASTDASTATSADASTAAARYASIAQAEENGSCAKGEAIVVYHASGAAKGSTGVLAIESDDDLLAEDGFAASETWDFSAADSVEGAVATQSESSTEVASSSDEGIASGSDVRVAYVKRSDMDTADLVAALEKLDYVECAQPNYVHAPSSATSPDDPLYASSLQWALTSDTAGIGYQAALDADAKAGADAEENIVAVIDTGVDYTNPDLAGVMWTNPGNIGLDGAHGYDCCNCDDDPMPGTLRTLTHGTHCAGLVAAQTDNGAGLAGVAQHTKIMALKVASDNRVDISDLGIVRAYEYLITAKLAGQNVVAASNSWLAGEYVPVLDYLVNQAGKAGVESFFGAGNDNMDVADESIEATVGLQSPYAIVVAASNSMNAYACYSNYDATSVDLASPGSFMLSTIRTSSKGSVCEYGYNPLTAFLTGQTPAYLVQMGSLLDSNGNLASGTSIVLMHSDDGVSWTLASSADSSHLSYTVETLYQKDGAISGGVKALKLTLADVEALGDTNLKNYRVEIAWTAANPFYGTDATPSDFIASCNCMLGTPGSIVSEKVAASGGVTTAEATGSTSAAFLDKYASSDLAISAIDATQQTMQLKAQVSMRSYYESQPLSGGVYCYLTTMAIDEQANKPCYSFMSGTSMATPFLAGCYAELASLYPDESALELRGRLVGSTVDLDTSYITSKDVDGVTKTTATDGRFTFAKALDSQGSAAGSDISANTWSISCDYPEITVSGYGLADAELYVDDAEHATPVAATSRNAYSIAFKADASLFDGAEHEFDVVDASTGRTYKASYVVPEQSAQATQLIRIGSLPASASFADGSLISATDHLFYADAAGTCLYGCSDPLDTASASGWTELSAPENVFSDASVALFTNLRYAYRDGKLYAFAASKPDTGESVATTLYYTVYDIATDTWSGLQKLDTLPAGIDDLKLGTCDGCCLNASYWLYAGTSQQLVDSIYCLEADGAQFKQVSVPSDLLGSGTVLGTYSKDGTLYCLALDNGAQSPVSLSYDGSTWSSLGEIGYTPDMTYIDIYNLDRTVRANTGNGIFLIAPDSYAGYGDSALIDPTGLVWTGLGSLLGTSTAQVTVTSAAMYGGTVYLAGGSQALYTLPAEADIQLETTDIVATADTAGNGSATVSDWRGKAGTGIEMRAGDTATWSATAGKDSVFAGWYDGAGEKVSGDAVYQTVEYEDVTLTARFTSTHVVRLFGDTALDTMSDIVRTGFAGTGGTVVLATLDNFPDALTASGIAGLADAPVLLTGGAALSPQTAKLLSVLRPATIIVCGGAQAVPDAVASAAKAAAGARRLYRCAGSTRSGTACEIYRNAKAYTGASFGKTAFVATGTGFADALAIAPYAYAQHFPVFLSEGAESVSDETIQTMLDGGITDFYVLGGTAAVSDGVVSQLEAAGIDFDGRLAGSSRYSTCAAIAGFEVENGMQVRGVAVATGENYKDALTGAAMCGKNGYVLLLACDADRTAIDEFVKANLPSIGNAYIFGGTAAVSQSTEEYLAAALGRGGSS